MKRLRTRRNNTRKRIENLTQPLTQRRIIIVPTRYGLMFIFILLAMLVGSVNYNNNLGFILTFLLGSMVFVSMFHTYRNLLGITVASAAAKPAFAGDRSLIEITLLVSQPSFGAIEFSFPSKHRAIKNLKANTQNRIIISLPAGKRGLFRPGPLTISTTYPFGLVRSQFMIDTGLICLIYPKPLKPSPHHSRWSSSGSLSGADEGTGSAPGVGDFTGLRTYRPGDSLQHIYWKAFSKGQGLLIKEFSAYQIDSIIFDWDRLGDKSVEEKLSLLCHLVLMAHNRTMVYGLQLPGKKIIPGNGTAHKHTCLKTLALYGLSPENIDHDQPVGRFFGRRNNP